MASNNLNPVVINGSKEASFFEKLRQHTVNNTPQSSGTVNVNRTSGASTFSVNPDLFEVPNISYERVDESLYSLPINVDPNSVDIGNTIINQVITKLSVDGNTDCAFWDKNKGYNVGQIVRVNKTYYAGTELDANGVTQDVYVFPGIYICVSAVPPAYTDEEKAIISALDDTELKAEIESTYRKQDVCYAPVWKHHDNPYGGWNEEKILGETATMLGGNGKGRYWDLLGLFPTKMKVCIDGIDTSIMICAIKIPTSNEGLPTV